MKNGPLHAKPGKGCEAKASAPERAVAPSGPGRGQRGRWADGPREGIGPPEARGPRGPRADRGAPGPEGRPLGGELGPEGTENAPPAGPGPRDPNKVFDRFDADKDGQLSREEFLKLSESVHKRMQAARAGRMGRGPGQGPARGDWQPLPQRRGPGGGPPLPGRGLEGPRGPEGQWQHHRGQGPGPRGEADGPRRPRRAGPPSEEAPPEQAPGEEVPAEEPI